MKTIRRAGADFVRDALPYRAPDGNKGSFGRVLALVGSDGMAGAAMFCAEAALRSGVGLLTAAIPRSIYPMVTTAVPCAVCLPLPETQPGVFSPEAADLVLAKLPTQTVLVVGCGLGRAPETERLIERVLSAAIQPIVLDADGLNWLAAHTDKRETVTAPLCLTPHPGEMARLLGVTAEEVQKDRVGAAKAAAERYRAVVVLKGRETVIALPDSEDVYVNPTGNDGMATGGSGDVLSGLIASLAAQGMPLSVAAICGAYLHGEAGDRAAAKVSRRGMLPRDLIAELGPLFLRYE